MGRTRRETLSLAVGPDVQLSPRLSTASLPAIVDTRRVVWPPNPHGGLPDDEVPTGAVTELSLLHPTTGAALPLPAVMDGGGVPLQFRMSAGACCDRVCQWSASRDAGPPWSQRYHWTTTILSSVVCGVYRACRGCECAVATIVPLLGRGGPRVELPRCHQRGLRGGGRAGVCNLHLLSLDGIHWKQRWPRRGVLHQCSGPGGGRWQHSGLCVAC